MFARGIDANDLCTPSRLVAKERKDMDWEFVDVEDGLRRAGLKSLFPDRVCPQLRPSFQQECCALL